MKVIHVSFGDFDEGFPSAWRFSREGDDYKNKVVNLDQRDAAAYMLRRLRIGDRPGIQVIVPGYSWCDGGTFYTLKEEP